MACNGYHYLIPSSIHGTFHIRMIRDKLILDNETLHVSSLFTHIFHDSDLLCIS